MRLGSLVASVLGIQLLTTGYPTRASAQSSPALTVSATGKHDRKSVTVEFTATNASKSRSYIRNLSLGFGEDALLSSGTRLQLPKIFGIEECHHDLNNCLGQNGQNLNEYSYVEPGASIPFTFTYTTAVPAPDHDTISLTVILIERQGQPNDDGHAGPARIVRFPVKAEL
jgi:hypothetical protein